MFLKKWMTNKHKKTGYSLFFLLKYFYDLSDIDKNQYNDFYLQ